uniref:NAD-dependent epimerase/dehydratase domain-containing protein n=1 Tax=Peronospora matthiolae TaxID=2874970 RepID=A0AAV1VFA7_9STRA
MTTANVLVLGGAGMVGRNFVKYLVDHDVVAAVRVADKTMPEIAYFSASHKQAFADKRVTFVQADLTRDAHVDRAFNPDFGPYDFVFNLAGESKCGLSETVYASKCRDLSVKCAKKAQDLGVKRYIEVSTAFVYKSQVKQPAKEDAELQPWTLQAKYELEAEEEIRRLPDLKAVFLRLATVYGSADSMGLMPRIVCAASYVKLQEKMKVLWDGEMRVNTVHVLDVCQALWHVTTAGNDGEIYNLVDKNDTTQAKINAILEVIFHIKSGFIGKLVSNLARVRLADVVDDANDKHMQPWADLCADHGITNTPLTPYIDKELLQHNHIYADGSKIESTGFRYKYPMLETKEVRAVLEEMIQQKIFPPILARE